MSENSPNLTVRREPPAVFDSAMSPGHSERARWWLGVAATALSIAGMRRHRRLPAAVLLLASTAFYRAAAGHDDLASIRSWIERFRERRRSLPEPVSTAAEDSFPASDPPAWTPTVGHVSDPARGV